MRTRQGAATRTDGGALAASGTDVSFKAPTRKATVDRYGHLTQDGRERCRPLVAATFEGYLPEKLSMGLAA